jgi:hypothetical protein
MKVEVNFLVHCTALGKNSAVGDMEWAGADDERITG